MLPAWAAIAAALVAAPAVDPGREAVEEGIAGLRANEAGRYADAVRDAEAALRMDRRHVWARIHAARALQGLGRHAEALRDAEEALRLAPDLGDAHAARGVVLFGLGRYRDAAADLRAAIEREGWHHPEAVHRAALAALALRRAGRDADARALLDEAAARTGGAADAEKGWPAPVIGYLRRQIHAEVLLGGPGGEGDPPGPRAAEARAYVGLDLAGHDAFADTALRHLEVAATAEVDADVLRVARAERNRVQARLDAAAAAAPGGVTVVNRDRPGQPVDLASFVVAGKTTIFDVYSEYCGPCMAIAPRLDELARRRSDIAVRKIDINRPGVVGIDWTSPAAERHVTPDAEGARAIPHFKIYAPDGRLVAEGGEASRRVFRLLEEAGVR